MSKSTKKHPTEDDQQFTITVEPEVISEGECVIVKQISTGCSVDTAGSTSSISLFSSDCIDISSTLSTGSGLLS